MRNNPDAMQEALRIAKSPEGQKLIQLVRQSDPGKLQQVLTSAASGNFNQAKDTLTALLDSPEAKELLSRMGGENGQHGR